MRRKFLHLSMVSAAVLALSGCGTSGYYDDLSAPETLAWQDAVNLIFTGDVESAMQTHQGVVTLNTKSGERFVTQTPKMDEILRVKKGCGAPCRDLAIAME